MDLSDAQKRELSTTVSQMLDYEVSLLKRNGYDNVHQMVFLAKGAVNSQLDKLVMRWEDHQLTVEANRIAREEHNKEIEAKRNEGNIS